MLSQPESDENPQIHLLEIAGNAIVGGMENYVYNLVQHLPATHFKVTVLTVYESPFTASLRQAGCDVYITSMDIDPPWRSIQFATELIRHQKIQLVHAHLPRAHVLAGLAANLTGIPAVATVHGMEITTQELGISRTTGTHLTVVCHQAYSQALGLGLPEERLTLIPNGVDTKLFSTNRSGAALKKSLRIPPNSPLVGFVGRLSWEKGPDQFVQLAGLVHEELPDVHFVIVGSGPMEDEIAGMIKAKNLQEVVHMPGSIANTWDVYPAFDLLVQTSRVEGMPFAILEAMASGKPVAAMGVGGVPEIVEVGTTGILSAGGDWEGLGRATAKLLLNPDKLKQMGHAARKRVEENFDWQYSVHSMENLYYRLLGRNVPKELLLQTPQNWPMVKQGNNTVEVETRSIFDKDG
ncbi:MAG: glycosyltransferase family 4 protein [Omnitrophica WOR_2 bacterium]